MRNSPRKRAGAAGCASPVEFTSLQQVARVGVGELRNLAATHHNIKNAALLKKPDLVEKLRLHFLHHHGVDLEVAGEADKLEEEVEVETDGGVEAAYDGSPISQTIDKLRNRIKEKQPGKEGGEPIETPEENVGGGTDRLIQLAEHALATSGEREQQQQPLPPPEKTDHTETVTATVVQEETVHTDEPSFDPSDVISEEVIENSSEENLYEEYITSDNVHEVPYTADHESIMEEREEEVTSTEEVVVRTPPPAPLQPKIVSTATIAATAATAAAVNKVCHAYVVAKTVKDLKDLGRDMLRIHAENHGITHASRLRMSELLKEMIEHYNSVHNAGLEISKLDMLKLNMLKLKKVKVQVKEKTPPPDFSKMVPKNVVPLEEQVHHVYEKRPDVCTVEIIVNNLKDMLALGTSILRPEASKHRVANSSRKQKLQVVEELWEHYLKFHLRDTEATEVVEEEYESDTGYEEYRQQTDTDFIVVREEDIVQGEEIQAVAEEVTE